MTPQEKDLITTLLTRLKNAGGQPKDPEAEALIRQAMAEQPDMAYYLAQTVLIQDLSLQNAQNLIAELERQLAKTQEQAVRPAAPSFLGGLFGGRSQSAPSSGSVPSAGPWTRAPQVAAAPPVQPQPMAQPGYGQPPYPPPGYGQPMGGMGGMMGGMGGGGFLRSAAATAAGIAGGALLFQGIESLFGQHASAGILGGQAATPGLGETVVNNYYGSDGGREAGGGNQDYSSAGFDPGGAGGGQDYTSNQDYSSDQDHNSGSQDYNSDQDSGGGSDWSSGGDNNTSC
jgi:uncharacterized protein